MGLKGGKHFQNGGADFDGLCSRHSEAQPVLRELVAQAFDCRRYAIEAGGGVIFRRRKCGLIHAVGPN